MNYKVIMKSEDVTREFSKEEIEENMKNNNIGNVVEFINYLYDEDGEICGIKGIANLGHGYGFNNESEYFFLKFGEQYSFEHEYTSVEGPSDWEDGSYKVVLDLIKLG